MAEQTQQRRRFWSWLDRDDEVKEFYLAEIGGSWASDVVALERLNKNYCARQTADGQVTVRALFTQATIKQWCSEDPEFAAALKVAQQMRAEARALGLDRQQTVQHVDPSLWPMQGQRLDQMFDPFRVYGMPGDDSVA